MAINGYTADLSTTMDLLKPGVEGKNLTIELEVDRLQEYRDGLKSEDQAMYFRHKVSKNMRLNMVGAVNLQTSKIHRHLIGMEGWSREVSYDDAETIEHFSIGCC